MAHRETWSKTAASSEMLNGVEKPPASLRIIPICCSLPVELHDFKCEEYSLGCTSQR